MDDGAFDQNFTWFEWGFVAPEDVPADDSRSAGAATGGYAAGLTMLDTWSEDHRWPTS